MQTVQLSNEKCARHSQRYCPEPGCYTPLVPNQTAQPPESKPGLEDQLVGRTEQSAKLFASVRPQATALVQASEPPKSEQVKVVQESSAIALVEASKAYAETVSAVEKALAVVSDLERRLEFCRENAAETIKAKDEAFQRVKSLVGEKS